MLHNLSTPFLIFNRKEWTAIQSNVKNTLSAHDIFCLKKIDNNLSINEIAEIYLPLSNLLNLHIQCHLKYQKSSTPLLNTTTTQNIPYIIGITGSVASGKSTTGRILQILLNKWPEHRRVELVTTDGFLYSNQILHQKSLMQKKGFPQSYNTYDLINFILKIKSGTQLITIPIYSHITYDIIQNFKQTIQNPKILILEGLNIFNTYNNQHLLCHHIFDNDFIDFSIYIDAAEFLLQEWYIHRFLKFCHISRFKKKSYFSQYYQCSIDKLISIASSIWNHINIINLKKNILPTKKHAHLILHKETNHTIHSISLNTSKFYKYI